MIGNGSQFIILEAKHGGVVTLKDNEKERIIDLNNIQNIPSTYIENILFVSGLKHNLINISQLCDKSFKVSFKSLHYNVTIDAKICQASEGELEWMVQLGL